MRASSQGRGSQSADLGDEADRGNLMNRQNSDRDFRLADGLNRRTFSVSRKPP